LAAGLFAYQTIEPDAAFQVVGETIAESRFEALHDGGVTRLFGREEELTLLLRRWQGVRKGAGHVAHITSEPGIGKSRLVRELRTRLSGEAYTRLVCSCAPHQQNSALYPFIQHLEHAAGFAYADGTADRWAKLKAHLRATDATPEAIVLLAELLSVPTNGCYPPIEMSPRQRRERMVEALIAHVVGAAGRLPVLLVFEDVHWIDPTSRAVLETLTERIRELPVLLITTSRPEFVPTWPSQTLAETLVLNRLDEREAAEMVSEVAHRTLPAELRHCIVERSDGVPLFVEELTKVSVESGAVSLPASLHDSLMARLDLMPAAKQVAQVGAVVGRSFSHELVATLLDQPDHALQQALDQLVASGLASRRGVIPQATYTFKHALVQNAAYESLPKSQRTAIHGCIVRALIAREPEIEDSRPDLLAHHAEQAGLAAQAVEYCMRAGWQSLHRGVFAEAREQFARALRLTTALPDGEVRVETELRALVGLGETVRFVAGQAHSEFGQIVTREIELCEQLPDPSGFLGVLFDRWVFRMHRGDFRCVLDEGDRLARWGEERGDIRGRIADHCCAGAGRTMRGELVAARSDLELAVQLYESCQADTTVVWDDQVRSLYRWSPWMVGNAYLGLVACWMGYPDQALAYVSAAVKRSDEVGTTSQVLIYRLARLRVWVVLLEPSSLAEPVDELFRLHHEFGAPYFGAVAKILKGHVIAHRDDPRAGCALVREGLAAHEATEAVAWLPYFYALLAETHRLLGDPEEALHILTDALELAQRNEERWCEAELNRRLGNAYWANGDLGAADHCFAQAIAVSCGQQARLWELRATTSRARLLRDQGRPGGHRPPSPAIRLVHRRFLHRTSARGEDAIG
jgi:tetratricopeptide (TPR) repeat protein